tara:strand:- start:56 stop:781 length:726 start_codon:yes stop_codon:yes gene_type:complete
MFSDISMNYNREILDFMSPPSELSDDLAPLILPHRPINMLSDNLENMLLMPNQILRELMMITNQPQINTRLNNIINESMYTKSKYKNVLSKKGEESLKNEKFNSKEHKNQKCPIMHINFSEGDDVMVLPCKHCFESESIMHWLKKEKAECPVCRYVLDSEEKTEEKTEENIEENTEERILNREELINAIIRVEPNWTRRSPQTENNINFFRNQLRILHPNWINSEENSDEIQEAILMSLQN